MADSSAMLSGKPPYYVALTALINLGQTAYAPAKILPLLYQQAVEVLVSNSVMQEGKFELTI